MTLGKKYTTEINKIHKIQALMVTLTQIFIIK